MIKEDHMRYLLGLSVILFANLPLIGIAQINNTTSYFCSGEYNEVKVSCDSISKDFTIIVDFQERNFGCTLFLLGKLFKNKEGKFPLKPYPYGFGKTAFEGTLSLHTSKKGEFDGIVVQLKESGSCQNLINFKGGDFFPLTKKFAYKKFSMVKTKKATAYNDGLLLSRTKGYLLEGDFVSIIAENKSFCYIEYVEKPKFKAWVKKSDLQLSM